MNTYFTDDKNPSEYFQITEVTGKMIQRGNQIGLALSFPSEKNVYLSTAEGKRRGFPILPEGSQKNYNVIEILSDQKAQLDNIRVWRYHEKDQNIPRTVGCVIDFTDNASAWVYVPEFEDTLLLPLEHNFLFVRELNIGDWLPVVIIPCGSNQELISLREVEVMSAVNADIVNLRRLLINSTKQPRVTKEFRNNSLVNFIVVRPRFFFTEEEEVVSLIYSP